MFGKIVRLIKDGGCYLMVESFREALENTNRLRFGLGLPEIETPWHNCFLNLSDMKGLENDKIRLESIDHLSSTYHFLSRVVYAKLCLDKGEQPRYDSEINLLSLQLPNFGEFGPVKGLVWRKR
jgi:hypothetical protein